MKKLSIWQWVSLGIAGAALVTEVVLVFVAPGTAIWAGGAFVLGGGSGYWLKKNNVVNK